MCLAQSLRTWKGAWPWAHAQQASNPQWWCTLRPGIVAAHSPVPSGLVGEASLSGLKQQNQAEEWLIAWAVWGTRQQTLIGPWDSLLLGAGTHLPSSFPSLALSSTLLWVICRKHVFSFCKIHVHFYSGITLNLEKSVQRTRLLYPVYQINFYPKCFTIVSFSIFIYAY